MKRTAEIKILIVEDDPFFQRILHKRISAEGYQVATAADGRSGMKAIVSFEPDLVISDWMMPEVDGLELCQSVKTGLGEAAPYFILLTAKGEISDRLLGLQTGADDYLIKPCDQGELMARVRAGLRVVLLNQELRKTVAELKRANVEVSRLEGLLRLCDHCQRICGPDGVWQGLDEFLATGFSKVLSHGSCPECEAGALDLRAAS